MPLFELLTAIKAARQILGLGGPDVGAYAKDTLHAAAAVYRVGLQPDERMG